MSTLLEASVEKGVDKKNAGNKNLRISALSGSL